ncbi:PREDICTED: microtubule-associated protein TORTIFOLIA1 isoform X1 [Tarenaya hassleriana]|uniref:microtubule-associated protein TORTIFOLIA1 isoform X2 n=1 Tax=Tarenaya hassleriana TaxID=28532 RepID=UPI00053C7A1C|nr:PREDICTED: microtubule-associated protein TORTIFOLIA1 isoform X2 [Tarenaya hassleriana]XP_010545213.1 PREDICTED: microtubule-associated protein TORTIFOLIA1 isoform X3 [Tarenaya hassleriana]XP_019058570.1 PREDICTED: microtubule-associated protein TORTIFOLIA1 isoform X1 [Tarenaya hassleriana]
MSTPATGARSGRSAKPLGAAARSSSSASASLSSHLAMVELKQKILTSLSKLADRDTHQIAVEDLEKTIQSLSPETLPMLLNCLYDSCSDPKPAVKKESLRLLSYVCSLHTDSTAAHLTKIIGQIVKRLKDSDSGVRDACRDAIGALSGIYLKGKEEGNNVGTASSVVGLFVKPLFEAMGEQNKAVQSAAALCMAKMVESAADPQVAAFQKLCPRICKLLGNPNFMAKSSLLPLVASLSQVGAITLQSLDSLLESIHGCLGSTDWATRKAAAEALIALALHSSSLVKDKADSTLTTLEACRFDKIKPVRDSMTEALQLWKKIGGKCVDGAVDEQSPSSVEQLGSEKIGEERSNLADLMKKEAPDGSILNLDSSCKGKGGIPEKAVVMLKKKAPALSDKELNPEFFQRLERRGSGDLPVEVVVPRGNKNVSNMNTTEESGHNDVDMRSSNHFKDVKVGDHGFPNSKFPSFETTSNKQAERRFDGMESRTGTAGEAIAKDSMNQKDTSTNHTTVSDIDSQSEGSLGNNRGNWSAIQRQLLQLERQQANLMNMVQEFIGGSHGSMVTLENRVRGLERIVEDMARDLSISSGRRANLPTGFGKYGGFPNYPTSKYNGRAPVGDRGSHPDGTMRGRTWTSDMADDWSIPPYAASRNGSRRSPRSEHENDHFGNGRRGWNKAAGSVRFGEGPSARSVWQASKDEATLEAIRVAGGGGGTITRPARVAAVPEAEAMAEDENGLQERDPIWTSWSNAMHSLRVGDMDSAYAEVLSIGDHHLLIKLMDRTGPVIDQLSNEIACEALNAIAQFLLDHNLYDICLSWIQQLLEVIVQEGPDVFGVAMELKTEILLNLQDSCATMEPPEEWEGPPPEQLVMQLSSAWDIDPQHFDK